MECQAELSQLAISTCAFNIWHANRNSVLFSLGKIFSPNLHGRPSLEQRITKCGWREGGRKGGSWRLALDIPSVTFLNSSSLWGPGNDPQDLGKPPSWPIFPLFFLLTATRKSQGRLFWHNIKDFVPVSFRMQSHANYLSLFAWTYIPGKNE